MAQASGMAGCDHTVGVHAERDRLRAAGDLIGLDGHLEGIGDRDADAAGWLGDPSGDAAIEGFRVHWCGARADVDIAYGCTVAGLRSSSRSLSGGYVGTRGRARPATGFWAELIGTDAEHYVLEFEAAFSARGCVAGQGGDEVRGEVPGDRLVALKLLVSQRDGAGERKPARSGTSSSYGHGRAGQ